MVRLSFALQSRLGALLALGVLAAGMLGGSGEARAQSASLRDVCGCAGSANSLGTFDTLDPSTWPAGTVQGGSGCSPVIQVPLPPDGVMIFDELRIGLARINSCSPGQQPPVVHFVADDTNAAATILVRGDVTIGGGASIEVSGRPGTNGSDGASGVGGRGGPGAFAGGEGAYVASNLASDGGTGVGPGGGLGGLAAPRTIANGGSFFGATELRPLVGGAGGGGGHSSSSSVGCSGAGGGGGGGALLLAVNGTLTVSGAVRANGGNGGVRGNGGCSSSGGGGSGGAIRLLANRIAGSGSVVAAGGSAGACSGGPDCANNGASGRIRLETITNDFRVDGANPTALRAPAPGALVNPVTPTVRITGVDGQATPLTPLGHRGQIDLIVDAPGPVRVDLASSDVPEGTDLEVTAKPKVGRAPTSQRVTLASSSCVGGACNVATTVDLQPGAYILEARATFETP